MPIRTYEVPATVSFDKLPKGHCVRQRAAKVLKKALAARRNVLACRRVMIGSESSERVLLRHVEFTLVQRQAEKMGEYLCIICLTSRYSV